MKKKPVMLALTGAGISKASGIPTFIDIPGIKEKLTVDYKATHKKEFDMAMEVLKGNVKGKNPNAAHKALTKFRVPIVTMNVDGLHQRAGSDIVVECHGNILSGSVVLYGEDGHYQGAFELLSLLNDRAELYSCKKVLFVIGTSMQTQFANDFVTIAIQDNWKIVEINEDAEHRVVQEIQKAIEELSIEE